jgi:hypothetical protein
MKSIKTLPAITLITLGLVLTGCSATGVGTIGHPSNPLHSYTPEKEKVTELAEDKKVITTEWTQRIEEATGNKKAELFLPELFNPVADVSNPEGNIDIREYEYPQEILDKYLEQLRTETSGLTEFEPGLGPDGENYDEIFDYKTWNFENDFYVIQIIQNPDRGKITEDNPNSNATFFRLLIKPS